MESIGKDPRVFIRPTASNGHLGGVAKSTYEAVALCEAAGYNYVFIETVGVGQSETVVSKLVDSFLFLAMPGTGMNFKELRRASWKWQILLRLIKMRFWSRSSCQSKRPRVEKCTSASFKS